MIDWFIRAVRVVGAVVGLGKKLVGPKSDPDITMPSGLSHRDVEHQQAQIRAATGCCPFRRSGGLHGEDCYDLGRADCTALKRRRTTAKPQPDEE